MIDRSERHRRFSARLVEAMGLASLTGIAVAGAACGGNVAVDTGVTSGAGGEGAGGGSSTAGPGGFGTVGSTSSGGPGCDVTVSEPDTLVYGCLALFGAACPPPEAPETRSLLASTLGLCDPTETQCCGQSVIDMVPCGPFSSPPDDCCYYAEVNPSLLCGMGRPFTVAGRGRAAPPAARGDWAAASSPEVAALDPVTRRALAEAWTREARFEHASVASFARLLLELLAVGAPAELVRDAQRAAGDEIRHAELCFALASAYAGAPVGPGPLPFEGALGRTSLAEVAAAAVREGCVGETIAALAAADARDAAVDPAVRAALAVLADDEAEHAAMAWRLTAWAFRSGDAEVRAAVAAAFAEDVDFGAEEGPKAPDAIDAAAFRAHGRLLPAEQRAHAARALAEVVRPSAEALLASLARC